MVTILKQDKTKYICELDEPLQNKIKKALTEVLTDTNDINKAMSSRITDLEDTITIKYI